jgi:hypothetical protein
MSRLLGCALRKVTFGKINILTSFRDINIGKCHLQVDSAVLEEL